MQIVLTQDVPNLGKKGEMKEVKNGYFRNFLGPRGKALRVTPKLTKQIEQQAAARAKRREEMLAKAEELAGRIEGMTLTFTQKVTNKGKLYAAITERSIQRQIEKHLNFDLDKGSVSLEKHIKELGEYNATVKLTESVTATVNVVVEGE